ncbi:tail fiber protein [Serratia marcescens]|nr:tail fiber protein [Serratia marcescens]
MGKNEFLPFGTAANANVLPNTDYQVLPARAVGFGSGVAKSEQMNTVWRQASTMAAVLAQFIADQSGQDVLDNGDLATLQINLENAVGIIPTGIPMPWPGSVAPTGWLKCNGSAFDKIKYPKLAIAYPSGILPDLRGEFIRGWDDGRGSDSGRSLLSAQGSTLLRTGAMEYYGADESNIDGAAGMGFANEDYVSNEQPSGAKSPVGALQPTSGTLNDNAIIGRTSTSWIAEGSRWIALRPRNIAFNYIVRAA